MMRIFVSNNVALLLLVVIITIDATRVLYLPLPKIYSSHHESKSSPIVQELAEKSKNDEFIPSSAMEHHMYEEQEENEKRDNLEWNTLVNQEATARRHINVHERSSADLNELNYLKYVDRDTRKPTKTIESDADTDEAINVISGLNDDQGLEKLWIVDTATGQTARLQSNPALDKMERRKRRNDALFLVIVGACSLVGILGLIAAAIFWYKIQKRAETALDAEYPSYGVTGPNSSGSKISPSSTMSDRKLARSAQMFHYQEKRQQLIAQEKANLNAQPVHSDDSDDETPAGGDYTVYECPGLAPTGEMEVRNPLFAEPDSSLTSSTSALHPTINNHYPQPSTSTPSSSPPKEKSLS